MPSPNVIAIWRDLERYGIAPRAIVVRPVDGAPFILHAPDALIFGYRYVGAEHLIVSAPTLTGIKYNPLLTPATITLHVPQLGSVVAAIAVDPAHTLLHVPSVTTLGGVQTATIDAGSLLAVAPEIAQALVDLFAGRSPIVIYAPNLAGFSNTLDATHHGVLRADNQNATWSTLVNTATATSVYQPDNASFYSMYLDEDVTTDQWDDLYRYGLTFDGSGIPAGSLVRSARLDVKQTTGRNDHSLDWTAVGFTPASASSYVVGDYDAFGSADYAPRQAVVSGSGTKSFTFNGEGRAAIAAMLGGDITLGTRFGDDIDVTAPPWQASFSGVIVNALDTDAPQLVIEWRYGAGVYRPAPVVVHAPAATISNPKYLFATHHGAIYYIVSSASWTTLVNQATGSAVSQSDSGTFYAVLADEDTTPDQWDFLYRYGVTFDGSAEPQRFISKAHLAVYRNSNREDHDELDVVVTSFAPADPDTYAVGDYDAFGSTFLSDTLDVGDDFGLPQEYKTFTLNTRGREHLESLLGSDLTLGARLTGDVTDTAPTWNTGTNFTGVVVDALNSNPARLIITYGDAGTYDTAPIVVHAPAVTTSPTGLVLTATYAGDIYYFASGGVSWSTIHDASAGTGSNFGSSVTPQVSLDSDATTDEWDWLYRAGWTFDLSSIPTGAKIDLAILKLKAGTKTSNFSGSVVPCSFSPADSASYAVADYDQFGTTDWASRETIAGISTTAYTAFTLNATAETAIESALGGNFTVGVRTSWDIDDSAPTWAADDRDHVTWEDINDANYPPLLVLSYTPPAAYPSPAPAVVHAPAVTTSGGA